MKNLIFLFIFALMASTVVGQGRIITPPSSPSPKSDKAKKTQIKDTRKTSITFDSDVTLHKKVIDLVDESEKVGRNVSCVQASNYGWGTYMRVVTDSTPLYYDSYVTGKKERLRINGLVMVFSKKPYNADDNSELKTEVLKALKKFDNSNGSLRQTQGEVVVRMVGADNQMKEKAINEYVLMARDFSAREIVTTTGLDAQTDMLFCFRYKKQNQFRRFIIVAKIDSDDKTISRDTLKNLLLEQAFLLYANTLNRSLNSFNKLEVIRKIEESPKIEKSPLDVGETVKVEPRITITVSSGGGVRNHFASVPAKVQGNDLIIAERASYNELYLGAAISYSTPIWGIEIRTKYGIVPNFGSSSFRSGNLFILGGELMYDNFFFGGELQTFSTNVGYQSVAVEVGYYFFGGNFGPFLGYRTFGEDVTGVTPINGRSATWKVQADEITAGVGFKKAQILGSLEVNAKVGVSLFSFDSEAKDQSRQNIQRVSTPTPFVQIMFGVPITLR